MKKSRSPSKSETPDWGDGWDDDAATKESWSGWADEEEEEEEWRDKEKAGRHHWGWWQEKQEKSWWQDKGEKTWGWREKWPKRSGSAKEKAKYNFLKKTCDAPDDVLRLASMGESRFRRLERNALARKSREDEEKARAEEEKKRTEQEQQAAAEWWYYYQQQYNHQLLQQQYYQQQQAWLGWQAGHSVLLLNL